MDVIEIAAEGLAPEPGSSIAVRANGVVLTSAIFGGRGSLRSQTDEAFANLRGILDTLDHTSADVVKLTRFVAARVWSQSGTVESATAAFLEGTRPAVATVIVHDFPNPRHLFAIEAVVGPASDDDPNSRVRVGADGLAYLSTVAPESNADEAEELPEQADEIYRRADSKMNGAGWNLADVVKTVEFVKPHVRRGYPKTGRARKEHLAPPYGGGTGIEMVDLTKPGALLQVDFTLSKLPRHILNPGWERYQRLTYNPGLRLGDRLIVLSGQAALDVETELAVHAGDVVAQTEYTYRNIAAVLGAQGLGAEAITKVVEYVTPEGMKRFDELEAVRARFFSSPYPVTTRVVCSSLLRPEFEIEIDCQAARP